MSISRTHRPRFFKDVTGQEHITETLRKEVSSGILGHAFLFSGPRGIGKTTTARILAKALLNAKTDDGEPPRDSEASNEVDAGSCIDLIEIDAASHTGVENVREAIIEHVRFSPSRWGRKVYIIDECHMLSTSAWNALLKTLEEPPAYAFFILATTELHKVPETIISRCQRFEFHRIAPDDLAKRVRLLAKEEGIKIDEDVVGMIAHASDGCVRDAESLLDQLASLEAKTITRDVASLVLPTSRIPETVKLLTTCLTRDVGASLAAAHAIVDGGVPPIDVMNDLVTIVRALIRCEDPAEKKRLDEGDEGDRAISTLIGLIDRTELGHLALTLIERRRDAKSGTDPQFILELIILAIAGGLLPRELSAARPPERPFPPAPPAAPRSAPAVDVKKEQSKTKSSHEEQKETETAPSDLRPHALTPSRPEAIDINDLRILWNSIIREVEKENRSIPFILKVAKPISSEANRITLLFAYDFHKEKIIDDLKMKGIVERAMASVLKFDNIIIDGIVGSAADETPSAVPHDIVEKVLNTFGGEIVPSRES
jgi:DNA polymerase III subunit gamma/tau